MSIMLHFHGLTKLEAATTFHGEAAHKFCCLDLTFTDNHDNSFVFTAFAHAANHPALARVAQAINEVGLNLDIELTARAGPPGSHTNGT